MELNDIIEIVIFSPFAAIMGSGRQMVLVIRTSTIEKSVGVLNRINRLEALRFATSIFEEVT